MKFSEAKREFDIRYFHWSNQLFDREIEEKFPVLGKFKLGPPWKCFQFMLGLSAADQHTLARALVKRFHPNAVKCLKANHSDQEASLLNKKDLQMTNVLTFHAEVKARKAGGEAIKFARKKELQARVKAGFLARFNQELSESTMAASTGPVLRFKIIKSGWVITTHFDFGHKEPHIRYSHSIASQELFPYKNAELPMIMGSLISFNAALGIESQTEWVYITPEEVGPTCELALDLCGRFFDVLPELLKNFDAKAMIPDELDLRGC